MIFCALCVAGGTPSCYCRLEGDVQGASKLACEPGNFLASLNGFSLASLGPYNYMFGYLSTDPDDKLITNRPEGMNLFA